MAGLSAGALSQAAGYEKANLWSGRYQGIAGAAASSVQGSESLFFNPAGMVGGGALLDASVNTSPTWVKSSAPLIANGTSVDSNTQTRWPSAITAKYNVLPTLAVGMGYFAAGGLGSDYGNVNFGINGLTYNPDYSATLAIKEFALGAAYEVMPGFSVGASWRITQVTGGFQLPEYNSTLSSIIGLNIHDLSGTNYSGFRIGAQYAPENKPFGFGLSIRTPTPTTLNGTMDLTVANVVSTGGEAGTSGAVSVPADFPLQVSLAGHYDLKPVTFFLQYDFTNYATSKSLAFSGSGAAPQDMGGTAIAAPTIGQNYSNQNAIRFGVEWAAMEDLAVRAGYVWTSQVTADGYARPVYFAPGAGNTFVIGGGYTFLNKALSVDLAFEYSKDSGTDTLNSDPNTQVFTGNYSDSNYAIHGGVTYKM